MQQRFPYLAPINTLPSVIEPSPYAIGVIT